MYTEASSGHEFLPVAEAADLLGVTHQTVRRKIAEGELPAVQLGRPGSHIRIPRDAFNACGAVGGRRQIMPRARKQPPDLDPSTTYVAWQSFAVEVDGYPVDVQKGSRLRGDHPTVQASWWYWLPDGAAPSELAARVRDVYPDPEVHIEAYERAKPPPPLRDEDAMVCIRPLSGALALAQKGIAPGEKVAKDSPAVKKNPDAFVDVVPLGLSRENAVVSKHTITAGDQVIVYKGQWIDRHHYEVERHPARFELPGLEGTTLESTRHAKKVKE
jgi:excisionase family DNA binding protein